MGVVGKIIQWADSVLAPPTISVDQLNPSASYGQQYTSPYDYSVWDGGKFPGGFGNTQIWDLDYWTLRERSSQLFTENLYARGLIRRLVTNEINTGLTPDACPDEQILGLPEDSLVDWGEEIENRFILWGKNPEICDWDKASTWGELQRIAKLESYIGGDVLVVLRVSQVTRLPQIQLIRGDAVQTPMSQKPRSGNRIEHGVELDRQGRHVAYWVLDKDGGNKRIPARGEKSGRRLAWLVYGTDRRHGDVRGVPLLSLIMQSLKEVDRYRDSTQRKAVINSILAMVVTKDEDKPGTLPIQGGAVRRDTVSTSNGDGTSRKLNIAQQIPGVVLDELQTGEDVKLKGGEGTDINFGPFEESIIQAIAWANEIPPEILRLAFSNNYSASQAAINEFKIFLNLRWADWGENFCTPIYVEWLVSEVLNGRVDAMGLLAAWRDPLQYDIFGAWVAVDWYGSIKPSTDMLKQAKGSKMLVDNGWSTNAREARTTTGTKFSKNIKRLKRENEQKAEALAPLVPDEEPEAEAVDFEAMIDDYLEARGINVQ